MKISVIVPAFNEEKLLPATLRSIQAATAAFSKRGWETELVVCDNNSTDRTAELARAHGALVVFEPVNQIGRARNRGAQTAAGDWLIFVDADSHPTADLFNDVANAITSGEYLAGGSTVRLDTSHLPLGAVVCLWNAISRAFRYAAGSFIFCRARAFRAIGGFNLELFASEELDLSRRLKKLARAEGKRLIILTRHPLVTSSRKMHLYSLREHLQFLLRTVVRLGKPLKSAQECFTWYDGRR
jgi:glycosyltransferase involved in cell wall biosynthesis